ncbi:hypothetical protein GCM10009557_03470 [Virgisporangium ochraceum]|uniref:Uncharacterized protein n=1 Tax=Virgisporangium ochraceum TaxID=65505 RepID=A0A8J3ZY37_9ACTN|nr:hypothetical protein [Virgisporangium ochraceum]GIJ70635.1 hypothetical protein Voc01_055520 [Virgisporangium ochraceum]
MIRSEAVEQLATLLSYVLVILALAISASITLKEMIRLYRAQAMTLTVVVLLASVLPDPPEYAVMLLAVLPAALAVYVPPLLAQASLAPEMAPEPAFGRSDRRRLRTRLAAWWRDLRGASADAELSLLQNGLSRLSGGVSAGVDLVLIATAVLVAARLLRGVEAGEDAAGDVVMSLAVAIALLLQGLFTMINKHDIVAQIIGLLVMEHGLFLAAVRVSPPALASLFMLSLFFYVAVTLTILLWILPEIHRVSASIQVSDNRLLRG